MTRDPAAMAGLVLLALLSAASLWLFQAAPSSPGDAGSRILAAARPDHSGTRLVRAERLLIAARSADSAGLVSEAHEGFSAAAAEGAAARDLAPEPALRQRAAQVWSEALLARAELFRRGARPAWWQRDDRAALQTAVILADSVRAAAPDQATAARATRIRDLADRQGRPRLLEWLPTR